MKREKKTQVIFLALAITSIIQMSLLGQGTKAEHSLDKDVNTLLLSSPDWGKKWAIFEERVLANTNTVSLLSEIVLNSSAELAKKNIEPHKLKLRRSVYYLMREGNMSFCNDKFRQTLIANALGVEDEACLVSIVQLLIKAGGDNDLMSVMEIGTYAANSDPRMLMVLFVACEGLANKVGSTNSIFSNQKRLFLERMNTLESKSTDMRGLMNTVREAAGKGLNNRDGLK